MRRFALTRLALLVILLGVKLAGCYSYTHPPTWPGDPTQLPPVHDRKADGGAR